MSKRPHLWIEWNWVHGGLLKCTTKSQHHLLNRVQAILILDCDWLWGRTNLQKFLYAFPCNHKLFVSHPAIYTIPFHTSIWEKFLYDFWVYNSNWIQKLCPRPFPKHCRYASILKGIHLDNPFHDNCCSFVAVIVFQICLNRLKIIRIRTCMLWGWSLRSWMFGKRHLHIKIENKEKIQVHKHKTKHKTWLDSS